MNAGLLSSSIETPVPAAPEQPEVDHSIRFPVMLFFSAGVFWLLVGSFLATLASFKLVAPHFLDFAGMLTYGRVQPAAMNAFVYGWASQAGLGLGIWMTARLCRTALRHRTLLTCSAVIWNIGILIGVLSILGGASRSIAWLEMPGVVTPILLLAYALMASWVLVMFRFRQPGDVFVSQWYLLAAFLAFPWLYAAASVLLVWQPVAGSATAPIQAWFGSGLLGLWLVPLALACAYYWIPKTVGNPVYSRGLASLGFWSLLLFTSWSGMNQLIGGPVPVWMVSASVVATVLLVIPMIAVAANLRLTIGDRDEVIGRSPALQFMIAGLSFYALLTVENALIAFPSVNSLFHFTVLTDGLTNSTVYGFVTMTFFGALYFLVPRLLGIAWAGGSWIGWHLWLAVTGAGLIALSAGLGALVQGFALNDPAIAFVNTIGFVFPFRVVIATGELTLLAANAIFALTFARTLLDFGSRPALVDQTAVEPREVVSV